MVHACVLSVGTHALARVWRSEVNSDAALHRPIRLVGERVPGCSLPHGPALKLLDSSVFASHLPVGGQELQVNVSPSRVLVVQNLVLPLTYKASVLPTDPSLHPNLKILILLPPPIKGWDYRNLTILVLLP